MGEGLQYIFSIADFPGEGLQWGEGLQYNTGILVRIKLVTM